MPKTEFTRNLDAVQSEVRPFLKEQGFLAKGRAFNCETDEGLVQVIHFHLDSNSFAFGVIHESSDEPPGQFWVEVGVHVPEVSNMSGNEALGWKKSYNCAIRRRMKGPDKYDPNGTLWNCLPASVIGRALISRFKDEVFPLFDRFATRTQIIAECDKPSDREPFIEGPSPVMSAAIFAKQGHSEIAKERLLHAYVTCQPEHQKIYGETLMKFAKRIGLSSFKLPSN